ncbi:hypothetical protein MAPG_10252 [Magnaporthiopsis poae ATCC 64411]|uniref:Diels-Alderase N-terminal domain-containing protein n=1 Tax=Magnaporthiopsis poae (strain ATCC 64411 / 73-15) TaxID=644358 RepID=A0A0C4EC38_MAGP6|nr:hypothetical protein MAPG_10252 [Magnaporthiopsis poae ATCC 64411]
MPRLSTSHNLLPVPLFRAPSKPSRSSQASQPNAFPKYVDAIGGKAPELWRLDAVSEVNQSALVGFTRRRQAAGRAWLRGAGPPGLGADKSTWTRDVFFPECNITDTKEKGVTGMWQDEIRGSGIS